MLETLASPSCLRCPSTRGQKPPISRAVLECTMKTNLKSDWHLRYSCGDEEGSDRARAIGFEGHEAISSLYTNYLELEVEHGWETAALDLLGQPITTTLEIETGQGNIERRFTGLVSEVSYFGETVTHARYRAEIVPRVWVLAQNSRCRIFQQKTPRQILEEVFAGYPVEFKLGGTYVSQNYTVQYNESDFAFASRLMEVHGIYFYFDFDSGDTEKLVIADNSSLAKEIVPGPLTFVTADIDVRTNLVIDRWSYTQRLAPHSFALTDYQFQLGRVVERGSSVPRRRLHDPAENGALPVASLESMKISRFTGEVTKQFDEISPTGVSDSKVLERLFGEETYRSDVRLKEQIAKNYYRGQGAGNCPQMRVGHSFHLTGHPSADGGYLILGLDHHASTADSAHGAFTYCNQFQCIPSQVEFRPERKTKRAIVHGAQTATVVGPAGKEVWTDKFGRVKVHFHWDTEGKMDGLDSCWLRVASSVAGNNWGTLQLPRVGQEVVVEFMDGDPDRPLITGTVYNGKNAPPANLPNAANQTIWKSKTIGGDANTQFCGIGIDDTSGHECLEIHSSRDMIESVDLNKLENIGGWQSTNIRAGHFRQVGGLCSHESPDGPFGWKTTVKGLPALDTDLVLGFKSQSLLGLKINYTTGSVRNVVFNPVAYLSTATFQTPELLLGWKSLLGGNLINGDVHAVQGAATRLLTGPSMTITRGPTVSGSFELMSPFGAGSFLHWFFKPIRFLRAGYFLDSLLGQIVDLLKDPLERICYADTPDSHVDFEEIFTLWGLGSSELSLYAWTLWEYEGATGAASADFINKVNHWYDLFVHNKVPAEKVVYSWKEIAKALVLRSGADKVGADDVPRADKNKGTQAHVHSTSGKHSIRCCGFNLTSGPRYDQLEEEYGRDSLVHIESTSKEGDGSIAIHASTEASVMAGNVLLTMKTGKEEGSGSASLHCGQKGVIILKNSPTAANEFIRLGSTGLSLKSKSEIKLNVSDKFSINVAADSIKIAQGKSNAIKMEQDKISLKVGASELTITDGEITLKSTKITKTATQVDTFSG